MPGLKLKPSGTKSKHSANYARAPLLVVVTYTLKIIVKIYTFILIHTRPPHTFKCSYPNNKTNFKATKPESILNLVQSY